MQTDLNLLAMGSLLSTDFGTLINSVQRDEVEAWPWSFLLSNFVLNSVPVQSAGTITINTGATLVIGSGTAFFATPNTQSFIHVGASNVALPIASIAGATHLTLSAPWTGAPISGGTYNIITPIYSIVGFLEVYAVKQILELTNVSRELLNTMDPARLATGGNPSVSWAPAGFDANSNVQIEIWEPPSNVLPYIVEGKLAAATMVNPADLPQLPTAVIENKALWKVCMANYASTGDQRWGTMAQSYYQIYEAELGKAQTADQQRANQRRIFNTRPSFGLDVIATHDMTVVRGG